MASFKIQGANFEISLNWRTPYIVHAKAAVPLAAHSTYLKSNEYTASQWLPDTQGYQSCSETLPKASCMVNIIHLIAFGRVTSVLISALNNGVNLVMVMIKFLMNVYFYELALKELFAIFKRGL